VTRGDAPATVLVVALVSGLTLDIWAHHHVGGIESFFTPWHAVMYGAFALTAIFLIASAARGMLPPGYGLALLGVLTFAIGGVGDAVWHQIFGVEVDLEAAVSPSHLFLALGGVLMVSGPLRAAWLRPGRPRGLEWLPPLVSLALTLTLITQLTEYANPYSRWWSAAPAPADAQLAQMLGLASIFVHAALTYGAVLIALSRWRLPFGAVTLLFGVNALFGSFAHDVYPTILVAVAGGLFADIVIAWLGPEPARPAALRIFAFVAPIALYGTYFAVVAALRGVWWPVPVWSGAIVLAGALVLLLTLLATTARRGSLATP
jgi:hypothetical protein